MMQPMFPLILVALGAAALVVVRSARWVLSALALHWLGLVWMLATAIPMPMGWSVLAVELITALVCVGMLVITDRSLQGDGVTGQADSEDAKWERQWRSHLRTPRVVDEGRRTKDEGQRTEDGEARAGAEYVPEQSGVSRVQNRADRLWLLIIVIASGVAGFGLARLYPLGGSEESLLAFYWTMLAGVLVLVLDAARSHVKTAVGLLLLLNGITLLAVTMSGSWPGVAVLGLLAIGRAGISVVLAYSWVLLKSAFREMDLTTLFDARSGGQSSAIVLATSPQNIDYQVRSTEPVRVYEAEGTGNSVLDTEYSVLSTGDEGGSDLEDSEEKNAGSQPLA